MNCDEKFKSLIEKNNGIILTSEAESKNIPRQYLSNLVQKNKLERVAQGVYVTSDTLLDEMYCIQVRSDKLIFSHETALYMHELTDRDPFQYTVTVPRGYATNRLRDSGLSVVTVKKDLHLLGMKKMKTIHGREVQVYNIDRTICDVIRSRNQMDKDMFCVTLKRYVKAKDKNFMRLMDYAQEFGAQKIVMQYIEGLLV
ncbi:MAG TPA: abortive phage infection protein [Epulopiscium sp.]|nr:abortive phage infection protein [Candidatus Epulonipiscium sp.]